MISMNELKKQLAGHIGTQSYTPTILKMLMTEGIVDLIKLAKCNWLITDAAVIIGNKIAVKSFVVIKIKVENNKATVTYDDGNYNILHTQQYEYTDLSEGEFEFYWQRNVFMLKSEY